MAKAWVASKATKFEETYKLGVAQYALCLCVLSHFSHVQLCVTLLTAACQLLCAWDSPDKNTGVGGLALLQGIFPTQGSNLLFYLTCMGRQVLYH